MVNYELNQSFKEKVPVRWATKRRCPPYNPQIFM